MSTWSQLRDQLLGTGLYLVAQLTRQSAHFQVSGSHHLEAVLNSGRPTLFTAWHGMTMMLVGFIGQQYDLSQLVLPMPDDWRGGNLAVFTRKFGATPFPMNLDGDNTLATARQLAKIVRLIKAGRGSYITPDGPDGPAYVIKPGLAYIARKVDAAILPMGAYTRHGYRLPRWDRYVVPYPFSRISICIGAPKARAGTKRANRCKRTADQYAASGDGASGCKLLRRSVNSK